MKTLIGVYGASGCGRGIMPLLRQQYPMSILVFIDDRLVGRQINGHDVVDWKQFVDDKRGSGGRYVSIAIASSKTREVLANRCAVAGVPMIEARSASVFQMDEVKIGEGACLSPFVTLGSNTSIGLCFHANLYSYVEHDCTVGDYVTLGPGAKVNGNVALGEHVYIGSGAVIRQGLKIGRCAVIGMGAVVTRDVSPGTTVIGNPARPIIRE